MKRTTLISVVAALGLAAPALAGDQLALSLGVEHGAYSTAELAQLRTAIEENDGQRIEMITGRDGISNRDLGPSSHRTQLARSLGVDRGAYSTAELARLRPAIEENDGQLIEMITGRDGISNRDVGPSSHQTQLARSLGVKPNAYSAAELARLRTAIEENDVQRIEMIRGAR